MKKSSRIKRFLKNFIYKLDEKMSLLIKVTLEPKLYSVIGFSLIASIAIAVIALVCQMCDVSEDIITGIAITGLVLMSAYIIKMLIPNIKLIESIGMKVLYVALNFVAVFIAGTLASYLLSAVIMLLVAYFVLMLVLGGLGSSDDSGESFTGRKYMGKVDGVKIYRQRGLGDSYEGNDGYSYYTNDGGKTFYRK